MQRMHMMFTPFFAAHGARSPQSSITDSPCKGVQPPQLHGTEVGKPGNASQAAASRLTPRPEHASPHRNAAVHASAAGDPETRAPRGPRELVKSHPRFGGVLTHDHDGSGHGWRSLVVKWWLLLLLPPCVRVRAGMCVH